MLILEAASHSDYTYKRPLFTSEHIIHVDMYTGSMLEKNKVIIVIGYEVTFRKLYSKYCII